MLRTPCRFPGSLCITSNGYNDDRITSLITISLEWMIYVAVRILRFDLFSLWVLYNIYWICSLTVPSYNYPSQKSLMSNCAHDRWKSFRKSKIFSSIFQTRLITALFTDTTLKIVFLQSREYACPFFLLWRLLCIQHARWQVIWQEKVSSSLRNTTFHPAMFQSSTNASWLLHH